MSNANAVPFATTFKVRDTCLCLHLQSAARAVGRRFDAALRPLGLTNGQFSLLMSLNRPEPASMGLISALLAMDRTTLTANLKPLERRGLVEVTVDAADKRSRRLKLTPAGRTLLAAAVPVWAETHAAIDGLLTGTNPDELRENLRGLSRASFETPAEPVLGPAEGRILVTQVADGCISSSTIAVEEAKR
jgi:DNA-binding MarR family transcriptional regulator